MKDFIQEMKDEYIPVDEVDEETSHEASSEEEELVTKVSYGSNV